MKNSDRSQRARRLGATLILLLLPVLPLQARGKSEAWARTQYATAERMREALNNLPTAQQSRREYQRVIAAYRRVYYGSPTSSKADPSVVAVAELLTAMGRRFDDDKVLRSAIGQYKFLRREYPGSRDRVDALFTMGQIYQDDLKDQAQAKQVFAGISPPLSSPPSGHRGPQGVGRTGAASRLAVEGRGRFGRRFQRPQGALREVGLSQEFRLHGG